MEVQKQNTSSERIVAKQREYLSAAPTKTKASDTPKRFSFHRNIVEIPETIIQSTNTGITGAVCDW